MDELPIRYYNAEPLESPECRLHNNSNLTGPSSPFSTPPRGLKRRRRSTNHRDGERAPEVAIVPIESAEAIPAKNIYDDARTYSLDLGNGDEVNGPESAGPGKPKRPYPLNYIKEYCKLGGGALTLDFCTLGMSFIDTTNSSGNLALGTIGGAGSFAALGARLFRQGISSDLVALFVNEVFEESPKLKDEILSWEMDFVFRELPESLSTKTWNEHLAIQEDQDITLPAPDFHLHPEMLVTERLSGSKTYHLTCGPVHCVKLVTAITERRARIDPHGLTGLCIMKRAIFVWRPLPCSCRPSELLHFYEALKYVDVISPNFAELLALFGTHLDSSEPLIRLKDGCNRLLALGFGNRPSAVVVRIGEQGCYIASLKRHTVMPAYHTCPDQLTDEERSTRPYRVVDTTGAGHAFLGGFCIGLLNDPHPLGLTEFEVAAIYGSVAASFAIEQVGMPKLSHHPGTSKKERWNDEAVRDRLTEFERRIELPELSKREQQRASLYYAIPMIKPRFERAEWPEFQRLRKGE